MLEKQDDVVGVVQEDCLVRQVLMVPKDQLVVLDPMALLVQLGTLDLKAKLAREAILDQLGKRENRQS